MRPDSVTRVLSDLVALNSVNPAYPGGIGEAAVAGYVERHCQQLGLDVTRQAVAPGRDNILATLAVPGATRTLLYEAHMDTVALAPMGENGLRPVVRDGKLYGRGACDTKGSLAAMLVALERLRDRRTELATNVALLASVDEEHAATGVIAFVASDAPASAAIVGEPTELRLVVAHKGCVRGTIRTVGRSAHSAEPERGISAIEGMTDVIDALRSLRNRFTERAHPLTGAPTFTIGLIDGGTGANIVPEECAITYDRRVIPGEDPAEVISEIDAALDSVRRARPDLAIHLDAPYLVDEALDTAPGSPLVHAARAACVDAGIDDAPVGVPYGTDASKLQARRGIPSIVFGPGSISRAHGADEYVPLDDLTTAVAVYEAIALRYSQKASRNDENHRSHPSGRQRAPGL
jgi:acetylornithine deacetylase ArgE